MTVDLSQTKKHHCWQRACMFARCFGCWIWVSVRNPDNIPIYLTALFTAFLATFAYYAWDEATRGTRAMQGQLHEMEAEQRPWIKIEKIAPKAFPIDPRFGGLMFHGPNTPGLLPLHFLLKIVGRSPAFDIRVGVEPVFGFPKVDDLAKEEQARCVSLDNAFPQTPMVVDSTTFIRVIFPGDEMPYDSALLVTPDQVRKFSAGDTGKEVFQLRFYGCVRYTFANSKEPHQTSFVYRVSHLVDAQIPGGKAIDVTFRPWEDIPADRIFLEARPMTSGVTN